MITQTGFPMLNRVGISVTTYEHIDGKSNVILTHIFWGKDLTEAKGYAHSHLISDIFFSGSFNGRLPWKGSVLILSNDYEIIDVHSFNNIQEINTFIEQLEDDGKRIYQKQREGGIVGAIRYISTE